MTEGSLAGPADGSADSPTAPGELGTGGTVTPARVLLGRSGTSYRTRTQLQLRADHAAARDALHEVVDLRSPPLAALVEQLGLFEVASAASSPGQHLADPGLGRRLGAAEADHLVEACGTGADLQIAVGDGLSGRAVLAQVPALLPLLVEGAEARGWTVGRPFFVRHCRVGIMNDVGAALDPEVVVLLVGERPGLTTAESLSAYLGFRPRPGHTDADRNLISNIHADGVSVPEAAGRILGLVAELRLQQRSGFRVRELDR